MSLPAAHPAVALLPLAASPPECVAVIVDGAGGGGPGAGHGHTGHHPPGAGAELTSLPV